MAKALRPCLLGMAVMLVAPGLPAQSGHDLLQQALVKERAEGNLQEAIDLYDRIVRGFPDDHALAAKALVQMGQCYEKLGKAEAKKAYERVVRDYADQAEPLQVARTRLAALTRPARHEMAVRKIWSDPMADVEGEVSPDGRFLSFVDWKTGDLAVRDLAMGENRRLTNKGSWEDSLSFALCSRWSPEGQRLAYDWWTEGEKTELRIARVENGESRLLYRPDETTALQTLDWSPDGREILVLLSSLPSVGSGGRQEQLATVSVTEGDLRIIKSWRNPYPYDFHGRGRFSPDGRFILHSRPSDQSGSALDLTILSRATNEETKLVDHPANDVPAEWSPDGQWVLFVSDRTGSLDLWMIPVEEGKAAGEARLVRSGIGRTASLGFDRRGRYFYGTWPEGQDIFTAALDPETGRVLPAPARAVERFEGQNDWPSYSRDGKKIAYLSARGSLTRPRASWNVLCVRSLESGEEKEYFTEFMRMYDPRFTPDGENVLVWGRRETGHMGLYRFDVGNGERSLVIEEGEGSSVWDYAVSPEGTTLYLSRCDEGEDACRLLKRSLESDVETEVYRGPNREPLTVALSPDGQKLAFLNSVLSKAGAERILRVMPSDGGPPRDIYRFTHPTNAPIRLAFCADGNSVLLPSKKGPPEESKATLLRLPITGGDPQDLGLAMVDLGHPTAHPDGERILFSSRGAEERDTEIWVIEGFLTRTTARLESER